MLQKQTTLNIRELKVNDKRLFEKEKGGKRSWGEIIKIFWDKQIAKIKDFSTSEVIEIPLTSIIASNKKYGKMAKKIASSFLTK